MHTQIVSPVSLVLSFKGGNSSAAKAVAMEECLVIDERAFRSPAQAVEDKLSQMLTSGCTGVSQLRLKSLLSGRSVKA